MIKGYFTSVINSVNWISCNSSKTHLGTFWKSDIDTMHRLLLKCFKDNNAERQVLWKHHCWDDKSYMFVAFKSLMWKKCTYFDHLEKECQAVFPTFQLDAIQSRGGGQFLSWVCKCNHRQMFRVHLCVIQGDFIRQQQQFCGGVLLGICVRESKRNKTFW